MTSANIVGYNSLPLENGKQASAANFVSIGTEGWWLTDLAFEGANSPKGDIQIQLMSTGGAVTNYYKYFKGSTASGYTTDGWYVKNTKTLVTPHDANDVFFPAGEGGWLKGIANLKVVSSGEVITEDCPVNLVKGKKMIVNPFPTQIKLTDIELLGVNAPKGEIQAQFLSSGGAVTNYYKYFKGSTASGFTTDGWYSKNTKTLITKENDVTLPVGFGMWVAGLDGAILNFKKPF